MKKHLISFEDLYYGLRLDYTNTPFFVENGSCGVNRFTSPRSGVAIIPTGGTFDDWDYPFTSTGFTSGNNGRLGVPEWNIQGRVDLDNGAELWEVFNDGTEILRGRFDESLGKFVSN